MFLMEAIRMSMYQLLGSLCHDRGWNYAVFWKLKHNKLIWGEAYCDFPKSGGVVKNVDGYPYFNNGAGLDYFGNSTSGSPGPDVGHPLELVVANMSCLVYSLGEGVIGQIVIAEKHHWIFAGKDSNIGEYSTLQSEFPNEWKKQFAAGVKTIALISVLPYGVVQLGSLETMREDVKLVDQIISLFTSLYTSHPGFSLTSIGCSSETLSWGSFPSVSATHFLREHVTEKDPGLGVLGDQVEKSELLDIKPEVSSLSSAEDGLEMSKNGMHVYKFGQTRDRCEHVAGAMLTASLEPSCMNHWLMEEHHLEQDVLKSFSSDPHLGMQRLPDAGCSFLSEGSTSDQLLGGRLLWSVTPTTADDAFSFPASSELHKALGRPSYMEGDACQGNFVNDNGFSSASPVIYQFDLEGRVETLLEDFEEQFINGNSSDYLLDAIVTDTCFSPQNKSHPQPVLAKSSNNSFAAVGVKCEAQDHFLYPALDYMYNNAGLQNIPFRPITVRSASCNMEEFAARDKVQGNDSLDSMFVSWSEQSAMISPDEEKRATSASKLSNSEVKSPNINKKRVKPGESCRPRPRDRQLIQDRIEELREIVPNGAKCSIDALFERTIKHMLFLRSITNHVDKLKNSKAVKEKGSDSQDANGGSWAIQLRSQAGSCPLVVENLSQPDHMLVEMLCEEHGVFLQMAQVIRSLGLTILKGVMEPREDKIWAHFVIEVTRDFQRMDILWPLMQLLQPRQNTTLNKF